MINYYKLFKSRKYKNLPPLQAYICNYNKIDDILNYKIRMLN